MERFAIKIDKKLKANLYKICRLCGIDNPDMVPIIMDKQEDKNENACIDVEAEMEMQQKINLLIGLSITKDDKMPQTMCCLCVDKINDFYEFREMCYATNAQTRKLLGLKNIKKPALDIKPKVEVKEESIVPTPTVTPATNKNGNRKRKSEEVALKEETPEMTAVSKKKLRFSLPAEPNVKEEIPVLTKKKLRFTALNEEPTPSTASSSKKSKNNAIEDTKLKKEPSPPVPVPPPAVSNKKLRLAAPSQKDLVAKKSKQKAVKNAEPKEADVKEEIKVEIKEDITPVATPVPPAKIAAAKGPLAKVPLTKIPPAPKLKFGCNICKERFPSKINLETHNKTTHIPKIERYVCTACNEVLAKSFDIKNHQLWHKLSKTPYICGCCGESILNTYAFSRHLREHAFETPPALLVLDRECPLCHTSHATNFLYNIHICAVKTKRCAGCNRLMRNDAEYLKHSAQCAKVYLNYSKHIMPTVEALEDAVRIKNENDVEAAAEEMARISGVSLDMAPVVQLTRLSSPLIMAASQCASMAALDDTASTSNKKSGKKGVSKKDLKRVDDLLKSTLDTLVSIKHEPEVHVDQETPCAGERSDNEDHHVAEDHVGGLDDFHHNDDSDKESEEADKSTKVSNITDISTATELGQEQVKIKQEIDETSEENSNKIGGGLKLKIKKEHGQLNSSIIEQQKSSEKRAEKRKKKKKHKDKEKDKQKLSKDIQDEQVSQDSSANNNNSETNIGKTTIRIKTEPQDETVAVEKSLTSVLQIRPQPEATIMTSIPMMQLQIACVSSGVEFNKGTNSAVEIASENHNAESEDVKPNREELDRMLKISHVSGGIAMETDETEVHETQTMDHDGNCGKGNNGDDDYQEESNEDDYHGDDNVSDYQEENQAEIPEDPQEEVENKIDNDGEKPSGKEIIAKKIKKTILQPKPKLTLKPKDKPSTTVIKSRNKACKSTAKPSNMPILQISAVQSGVTLEPPVPSTNEFSPIFIKPEPQNRGYSDEQPADTLPEPAETQEESEELLQTHSPDEQNYISSIDFNNITIKQEKDIEINDVQTTEKFIKSFTDLNGIRRKRKQAARRSHIFKDKTLENEKVENQDENIEDEEEHETEEGTEEEIDDEECEEEEEEPEEEEDEDEEELEEEEEEREYRELEYPPELVVEKAEQETEEYNERNKENSGEALGADDDINVKENIYDTPKDLDRNTAFVIASVCSQATDVSVSKSNENVDDTQILLNNDNVLAPESESYTDDFKMNSEQDDNKTLVLGFPLADKDVHILSYTTNKESHDTHLTSVAGSSNNSNVSLTAPEIPYKPQADLNITITSTESTAENTHPVPPTLAMQALQENNQPEQISLQLDLELEQFQIKPDGETPEDSKSSEKSQILESSLEPLQTTQNSGEQLQNQVTHSQFMAQNPQEIMGDNRILQLVDQECQSEKKQKPESTPQCTDQDFILNQEIIRSDVQENLQNINYSTADDQNDQEHRHGLKDLQQNLQNIIEHSQEMQSSSPALLEDLPNIHNFEVQPQTSEYLQPVFEISSVRTTAANVSPELNNNPVSNYEGHQISKDNQEDTATIEGVVQQPKDVNLEAQPVAENFYNESINDDENDEDENEDADGNEVEEEYNNDESTLGNNLEELQNDQNQEVLSQIRPTALALHPYLEDISSSSNSFLSNSLSQTPPPPLQPAPSTACVDEFNLQRQTQQRLLNTEETENVLNESNDVLNRRSLEVAGTSVGQPLTQPHLGQQLPPHMPTFNFDNINEIAENNNNANIEREQLQDGQQHHQHPTTNNP